MEDTESSHLHMALKILRFRKWQRFLLLYISFFFVSLAYELCEYFLFYLITRELPQQVNQYQTLRNFDMKVATDPMEFLHSIKDWLQFDLLSRKTSFHRCVDDSKISTVARHPLLTSFSSLTHRFSLFRS